MQPKNVIDRKKRSTGTHDQFPDSKAHTPELLLLAQ